MMRFLLSRDGVILMMVIVVIVAVGFLKNEAPEPPIPLPLVSEIKDDFNTTTGTYEELHRRSVQQLPTPASPPPTPSKPQPITPPAQPVLFSREVPEPTSTPTRNFVYGTILRCQLITGIQSASVQAPIIAKLTHTVHGLGITLPAGTELHGTSQSSRLRDRIQTASEWIIVTGNQELKLSGVALHHDQDPETHAFGIDDMTLGIKGTLHETNELQAYKRFAAAILSRGSRTTRRNDVLETMADGYLESLQSDVPDDGHYVSVPAGTKFYIILRPTT